MRNVNVCINDVIFGRFASRPVMPDSAENQTFPTAAWGHNQKSDRNKRFQDEKSGATQPESVHTVDVCAPCFLK